MILSLFRIDLGCLDVIVSALVLELVWRNI